MTRIVLPAAVVASLAGAAVVVSQGAAAAPAATQATSLRTTADARAASTPVADLPTHRLRGDVLPGLRPALDRGATAPSTRVLVGIVIANPHAAAERRLAAALYTKSSGQYHHFLTPAQYAARFAASGTNYTTIRRWATRRGLTVAHTTPMHDYLTVTGTAAQAQRTFGVQLHTYGRGAKSYYANTTAPLVPSNLGITGVIGLNSKLKMSTPRTTAKVSPQQDGCQPVGACTGLTTPQDLWSVYDMPGNNYGEGQSMAIFGEGKTDPVITNLREFEKVHDLPQVPVQVVHTDGTNVKYDDNSGEVEWDLDTQSSTGMAPNVMQEKLYFASSLSDASVAGEFQTWADDATGPLQASASFGECEENILGNASATAGYPFAAGVQFTQQSEAALVQAVSEGRTLFASTGDTGSSCPIVPVDVNGVANEAFPVVNYPASSPEVVAVGGTVLYGDGTGADQTGETPSGEQRVTEYSWNFTGGGTSVTFPQPDYQKKYSAPMPTADCLDDPSGNPVSGPVPCRAIPDIAAQSGDVASNGYAIVSGGQTNYPGGGTSLSSPLSLGMWTRINATAPAANGTFPGYGFANESYYADYAKNPGDFFDVGGGVQSPPNSNGAYVSAPGDDYLSGLGVPKVAQIARHLDPSGSTAPANDVLPTYPAPGSGGTSGGLVPCNSPLFTDPAGDDAYIGDPAMGGSNPQLDILSGSMKDDGTALTTTMTIKDLSTTMASAVGEGNDYYFLWSFGGTPYFSLAEVDTITGTITYSDGTVAGNQFNTVNKTDTGTFTPGANGTVSVTVPLAHIGSPASGALLTGPAAQTRVLEGSTTTGGLIEQADAAGPQYDYAVGGACTPAPTTTSPAPSTSASSSSASTSSAPSTSSSATPTPTSSAPVLPSLIPATPSSSSSAAPTSTVTQTVTQTQTATATQTATQTATETATATQTATTTQTATQTVTATATPSSSPTSPAPTPQPAPKPKAGIHVAVGKAHTSNGVTRVAVTITDGSGGIVRIGNVTLTRCTWTLGKAGTHYWSPAAQQVAFVLRSHTRTGARAVFTVVDKAGHKVTVHVRL